MERPRRFVFIILFVLFVVAIAARVSTTESTDSPYFTGTSAMAYRHMLAVADGHSLSARDDKAGSPEGYSPARYRAAGAETITGLVFRGVRAVSDVDGRPFTRRLTILIASLCVFTAYGVASRLWKSRGAGLLAAFLVAFLPALLEATNGRLFSHVIFGAFFGSLYAVLALCALMDRSRAACVYAALAALVFLWVVESARYPLAICVAAVALVGGIDRRTRLWFVISHTLVITAASIVIPHLAAVRAAGAWTTAVVFASAVVVLLPASRRHAWRAPVVLAAIALGVTVLMTPFRAGAAEQFPALEYVFTRLRYLFGRPSPSLLSDWMRHLWSAEHSPITTEQALALLIPLGLCVIAWLLNRDVRAGRTRFAVTLVVFAVACTAAVIDRSVLPAPALAMIVVVSGAAVNLDWRRWKQSAWLGLAIYTMVAGVVLARKSADVIHHIARSAGVAARDPSTFVWISFENTDRELIRFIATRTSVDESILAPESLSGILVAFSGRTSVRLPGTTSRVPSLRHIELTRAFYRDEAALYELCHQNRIDYVVYTIDTVLDTGAYSQRYLAAASALDPSSIAMRMHFEPESLRHFTLMYQNDHYRVFKVTEAPEPVFLTDHPLFYQHELFARDGRDIEHFRDHVIWLMVNYANAMSMRSRGDAEQAQRMLDQCVRQAPRFTRARLALADAMMDLGHYDAARNQIAKVIEYAPDNPAALYAAAFVQLQLGNRDGARPYLELLAQTGDREMIEKGRSLQYYIEHDIPLKPGAPQ